MWLTTFVTIYRWMLVCYDVQIKEIKTIYEAKSSCEKWVVTALYYDRII